MDSIKLTLVIYLCGTLMAGQVSGYWIKRFADLDQLDDKDWIVDQTCDGNKHYLHQLNCNTNERKNLNITDGSLALTAVYGRHRIGDNEQNITAAWIQTRRGFDFTKIEIRMALPSGKLVRPAVYLLNENTSLGWPAMGQIEFAVYSNKLWQGVHGSWTWDGQHGESYITSSNTTVDLRQFQTYTLEKSDSMIVWKIDDQVQMEFVYDQVQWKAPGNPFLKGNKFNLFVTLGVGGHDDGGHYFFDGDQNITANEALNWNCSSLIIDYIKITESGAAGGRDPDIIPSVNKATDICKRIMANLKPIPSEVNSSKVTSTVMLIIFCLAILVIIISSILCYARRTFNLPSYHANFTNSRQMLTQSDSVP